MNAHGAGGTKEEVCSFWDPRVTANVVLLCLAGVPLDRRVPEGGHYFPDHHSLGREVAAGLDAIRKRLPEGALEPNYRFLGYSQGATMGALALVGGELGFADLILIEGGGENFTALRARRFFEEGGRRVVLACGTRSCDEHGRRALAALTGAGVRATHLSMPGAGHTYGGLVARSVVDAMSGW